jgi:tryptophan synthase alpha chain
MSYLKSYIEGLNNKNRKALSVFLTAGYPEKDKFLQLALDILESGADMLELGMPFSDPIADGPVIQHSSQRALDNGIDIKDALHFATAIKSRSNKPVILMGYSNPILAYGLTRFVTDARDSGVDGLIIPDIPLEEHHGFWDCDLKELDVILLTTPTSSPERIEEIDQMSSGFVYCVSVTGTTGIRSMFDESAMDNIQRTYHKIVKNKMMIGFGISSAQNVIDFTPHCDGVIVGSAVVKSIMKDIEQNSGNKSTLKLIQELSAACNNPV